MCFWESLERVVAENSNPWVVFGDLNEIVDISEKSGGRDLTGKRLFLKEFLCISGGVDLECTGRKFTWSNRQTMQIKERLDRAVASTSWMHCFPNALVTNLETTESDHSPILIQTAGMDVKLVRPFRFLSAWVSDRDSFKVVDEAWNTQVRTGKEYFQMSQRIQATSKALKSWNKEHFGLVHENIKLLEDELRDLQTMEDQGGDGKSERQREIINDLRIQKARQEMIFKQKSRELWLTEGDKNSKFFHASTLIHRRRNQIGQQT